jgi:uncharacterized protein YbjT (DUF2867 family)
MRVIVLGGTWFVGRAITGALTAAGHSVLMVHRGASEPPELPRVQHLHAERSTWPEHRAEFTVFQADAAVDVSAGDGGGGTSLELVRVPDETLPSDLRDTGALSQHLLASPARATSILRWRDTVSRQTLRQAVTWHLDHPPSVSLGDFSDDDAALARALQDTSFGPSCRAGHGLWPMTTQRMP